MPSVINVNTGTDTEPDRHRTHPKQLRSVDVYGRRLHFLERSLGYYRLTSMG